GLAFVRLAAERGGQRRADPGLAIVRLQAEHPVLGDRRECRHSAVLPGQLSLVEGDLELAERQVERAPAQHDLLVLVRLERRREAAVVEGGRQPEAWIEGARSLSGILGKQIGPGVERRRQKVGSLPGALSVKERRLGGGEELSGTARARDRQVVQPLQRLLRVVGVERVQISLEEDVVSRRAEL